MKMKVKFAFLTVLMGITMFIISCGDKPIDVDPTPYAKAIKSYLNSEHMDMKINKFKTLTVEGGIAKATCSMKSQTGLGPAVVWKFEFSKENDLWKVSKFQQ